MFDLYWSVVQQHRQLILLVLDSLHLCVRWVNTELVEHLTLWLFDILVVVFQILRMLILFSEAEDWLWCGSEQLSSLDLISKVIRFALTH